MKQQWILSLLQSLALSLSSPASLAWYRQHQQIYHHRHCRRWLCLWSPIALAVSTVCLLVSTEKWLPGGITVDRARLFCKLAALPLWPLQLQFLMTPFLFQYHRTHVPMPFSARLNPFAMASSCACNAGWIADLSRILSPSLHPVSDAVGTAMLSGTCADQARA